MENPDSERRLFPVFPGCRDCLMGLAEAAADLAAEDDAQIRDRAAAMGRAVLDDPNNRDLSSPELANKMLRAMKEITGVSDPYAGRKAEEMARAREIAAHLDLDSERGLDRAVKASALGNSLDFFVTAEQAFDGLTQTWENFTFLHNDIQRLAACLEKKPGLILFFTDNAGEVFFDLPLYRLLAQQAERMILVVKGGAALNDLTRADLERENLIGEFSEVSDNGIDGAGVDWDNVSPEFLDLVNRADLIVSKGMANLETVYPKKLPCPVFYLFKVKCEPVKDWIHAPAGSFWALWKDPER